MEGMGVRGMRSILRMRGGSIWRSEFVVPFLGLLFWFIDGAFLGRWRGRLRGWGVVFRTWPLLGSDRLTICFTDTVPKRKTSLVRMLVLDVSWS